MVKSRVVLAKERMGRFMMSAGVQPSSITIECYLRQEGSDHWVKMTLDNSALIMGIYQTKLLLDVRPTWT